MNIQRQAGLGAFGAAAGILVLFAAFVWWTVPGPDTGMDWTSAVVAWISVGGVALTLIAAHVLIARVLVKAPREGVDDRE